MKEHEKKTTPVGDAGSVLSSLGDHGFDLELNLCGLAWPDAEVELERLLSEPQRGLRVGVRLDPPAGDGAESLFQPVGRRLLAAMKSHCIRECRPFAPETAAIGFVFTFA